MTLFIILGIWAVGFLWTFRYTGHELTVPLTLDDDCQWPSICQACHCKNCGDSRYTHEGSFSTLGCDNYESKSQHTSDIVLLPLLTLLFWPLYWIARGSKRAAVALDWSPNYFKAPRPIETKDQKIARQEQEIKELEKELGYE
jgi:hypothetical protein